MNKKKKILLGTLIPIGLVGIALATTLPFIVKCNPNTSGGDGNDVPPYSTDGFAFSVRFGPSFTKVSHGVYDLKLGGGITMHECEFQIYWYSTKIIHETVILDNLTISVIDGSGLNAYKNVSPVGTPELVISHLYNDPMYGHVKLDAINNAHTKNVSMTINVSDNV